MSGGSYDYAFRHLSDLAEQIDSKTRERDSKNSLERLNFAELLRLCSTAAHAIEWRDSGDWGDAQMLESIAACFEFAKTVSVTPRETPKNFEDKHVQAVWNAFKKESPAMGWNHEMVCKQMLQMIHLYRKLEGTK